MDILVCLKLICLVLESHHFNHVRQAAESDSNFSQHCVYYNGITPAPSLMKKEKKHGTKFHTFLVPINTRRRWKQLCGL